MNTPKIAIVQSYGWRAASCLSLVMYLKASCDEVVVLCEADYSEENQEYLKVAGATVVDCPEDNGSNLAQFYRWLYLDLVLNKEAIVLMVDDDKIVSAENFFAGVVDEFTYVSAGGTSTTPQFVWCGVGCFHSSLMSGFTASDFFKDDAAAGNTDEIALNKWLRHKKANIEIVPAKNTPASFDYRSLNRQEAHLDIRNSQFEKLKTSNPEMSEAAEIAIKSTCHALSFARREAEVKRRKSGI